MDYDRNSFAKNIDGLVTLYDVRSTYNKHRNLIHSDDGLKDKFKKRITGLVRKEDEVTGDIIPVSHCPLMIAAVEEILEYLEDGIYTPPPKVSLKDEEEIIEVPIKKKRPSLFTQDSNNLEDFFNNRSESGNLLEEVNLEVIKKALEKHEFNLTKASKYLGISPRTLRTKIQEIKNREVVCE